VKVSRKLILPLILLILSCIPLFDLAKPGMFFSHDGEAHLGRLAAFYRSLTEGNLIPRWGGSLNGGFGHPVLMFLFPLPMYLGSIFHFLGFSLIDSIKLIFGLSFIASGLAMYFWIKEIWGEEASFAASLLYMFAPYRFVDIFVRGAIGENLAFVWPPLICLFALKLSQGFKWKYLFSGSLSLAALILSHNALSLMFLPIIFGYMIFLVFQSRLKILYTLYFILYTFFGFSLSAFFWIPALFEGKYTLRNIVIGSGEFINHFPQFSQLINSPWGYGGSPTGFSFQIGIVQWLTILTSPFILYQFWRKKDKAWLFYSGIIFLFIIVLFLLLPVSIPLWQKISLLQKFQFPWRFLSLMVFLPAVLAGGLIYVLPKQVKLFSVFCLLFSAFCLNKDFWHAQGYFQKTDQYFQEEYKGTTDTGESSPLWGIRGYDGKLRKANIELISGRAAVKELKRLSNIHLYEVEVTSDNAQFLENTVYFPGWKVFVDGKEVEVEYQDPNHRGLLTFFIPQGTHELKVIFSETKLRRFANLISLFSISILIIVGIIAKRKLWSKSRLPWQSLTKKKYKRISSKKKLW